MGVLKGWEKKGKGQHKRKGVVYCRNLSAAGSETRGAMSSILKGWGGAEGEGTISERASQAGHKFIVGTERKGMVGSIKKKFAEATKSRVRGNGGGLTGESGRKNKISEMSGGGAKGRAQIRRKRRCGTGKFGVQ